MTVTRRQLLERLAAQGDAGTGETTTAALVAAVDADAATVRSHLAALESCDLVRTDADGRVRITVTGEELLSLDVDDVVIIDEH